MKKYQKIDIEDIKFIDWREQKEPKSRVKSRRIDVPSDHNSKIFCFLFQGNGTVLYNQRIGNDGDLLYKWEQS